MSQRVVGWTGLLPPAHVAPLSPSLSALSPITPTVYGIYVGCNPVRYALTNRPRTDSRHTGFELCPRYVARCQTTLAVSNSGRSVLPLSIYLRAMLAWNSRAACSPSGHSQMTALLPSSAHLTAHRTPPSYAPEPSTPGTWPALRPIRVRSWGVFQSGTRCAVSGSSIAARIFACIRSISSSPGLDPVTSHRPRQVRFPPNHVGQRRCSSGPGTPARGAAAHTRRSAAAGWTPRAAQAGTPGSPSLAARRLRPRTAIGSPRCHRTIRPQ